MDLHRVMLQLGGFVADGLGENDFIAFAQVGRGVRSGQLIVG